MGMTILSAGEQGLVVEFGQSIDQAVNQQVHQLAQRIRAAYLPGVREVVPTYRSLLVNFEPLTISRVELTAYIEKLLVSGNAEQGDGSKRVIPIPVCYGSEYGPDLGFVASHNKLTIDEVIAIHTATPYLVYMLGFTPGFPYLGGLSERLATPRLQQPRTVIPAGSVGIAGLQTGFYPVASPGGWQLIGRTPVKAFHAERAKPFLFDAGDYLRFYAISYEEYGHLALQVEQGWQPEAETLVGGDLS